MGEPRERLFGRYIADECRPAATMRRVVRMIGVLAAVLLLVGSVVMSGKADRPPALRSSRNMVDTISAPVGRPATFSLPDGSKVTLSPGSTLAYGLTADAAQWREVRLTGEAYFEVHHDEHRPFVLRAGDLIADIDAKCVVRAYPEDQHARVVVREGAVKLAGQVVGPGQLGQLSAGGKPLIASVDTASWFAWMNGKLVFTNSFREAVPRLIRWYDLDLRLADSSIGDAVLAATVPDVLVDGTLEAIALALSARLERRGRIVTFYPDVRSRFYTERKTPLIHARTDASSP